MIKWNDAIRQLSRRAFVCNGSLLILGAGKGLQHIFQAAADRSKPKLRMGLITDLHYADKEPAGNRHYRESLTKLQEAAKQFQVEQPEIIVEMGDLIDAADSIDVELGYLKTINQVFAELPGEKHYVLGNHCVSTLTKEEFLGNVGQEKAHYSFDAGGFHFVILDACFNSDGQPYGRQNFVWNDANIPLEQLEWLKDDLTQTTLPTIVFAHQRLDEAAEYSVKNAPHVRQVLEESEKVMAVFQGHSHENSYQEIGGIHYCVLAAMIEGTGEDNNGYSTLDLFDDGSVRLSGFRKQANYQWTASPK